MTGSLIQLALDGLFAGTTLFAIGAITTTWRAMAPKFAALRKELAAGDPLRDLRITVMTTQTFVTRAPRRAVIARPAAAALRAAA